MMRLSPGLHRVGDDIVSCYLFSDDRGVTVVDAALPGHWAEFLTELSIMGRSPADVRAVLLTHGDEDHIGFAERLRAEHGVPVWVHEEDAGRARGEGKPPVAWGQVRVGPLLRFLWYGARKGGFRTTYLRQVRTFTGGEILDLPGAPSIIAMPGHSPGSVAIHVPAFRALFVGDAFTTGNVLTGATGPGPAPFTDAPAQAMTSWANLAGIEVDWVLPGHGAPWRDGVAEAIRRARGTPPSQDPHQP